jgi:hypothetical protein
MSREAHVQFCESLGVRFHGATHRNIYVGSKRAGERIMQAVTTFLEQRLKLKVNVSKSAVARPWERMFLGYSMTWHKKPKLKIAQQSRERLAEKIRKTLQGARGGSLEQAIERLNPVLRGWIVYFRLTEVKGVLEDLDGWIRRKLRALLWRHWKRVYTRTKNLMRAGVRGRTSVAISHQWAWPMVERRRIAHERRLPEVLVRPHGVGFVAGNSATSYTCFMNRRMPNGTSGDVGGRQGRPCLLPDAVPASLVSTQTSPASERPGG